jgi:hypothetical protein
MRAAVLVLALVAAGTAPVLAQRSREEVRDVPWYQARPQILEETLRRCHRDARLAATWDCQNAEGAASSRLGQPLPNTFPSQRAPSRDSSDLPEPDFNPRTNPFGYRQLQAACANRAANPTHMFLPYCNQLDRHSGGGAGGR